MLSKAEKYLLRQFIQYLAHRKTEIREAHETHETHGITSDWHSETGERYSSMRWHERNVVAM